MNAAFDWGALGAPVLARAFRSTRPASDPQGDTVMIPGQFVLPNDAMAYDLREMLVRDGMPVMILVTHGDVHAWALIGYQVGGWRCLATGTVPGGTTRAAAELITARYGNGFHRIPLSGHGLPSRNTNTVHLLKEPGSPLTYCGTTAPRPYTPADPDGSGRMPHYQHCPACDVAYRAAHYGRCPLESFQ